MDFCAVVVALGAILGVVQKPVFVFLDELLEISSVFQCVPLLFKSDLEIFPFGFQYLWVINEIGFVEQSPCSFEACVFQNAQLLEVQVNRVQCKSRDGIVRIRIVPVIMRGRVVDGQDLDDFQSVGHAPVAQFRQIGIFADAEIVLRTQAEQRHGHAFHRLAFGETEPIPNAVFALGQNAVGAILPMDLVVFADEIFVFRGR